MITDYGLSLIPFYPHAFLPSSLFFQVLLQNNPTHYEYQASEGGE